MVNILLPLIIPTNKTDFQEFKEKITAFEKHQAKVEDSLNNIRSSRTNYAKNKDINITPFYFDPNNLPVSEWKKLGLKDHQIEMIKKYELKGGKFYQPEHLAKMYSISDEEFKILEPYIVIEKKREADLTPSLLPFTFDPNRISREELQKMQMRENLINAIINYRNKGGKFFNKKDLQKIYTISEEEYLQLEPFIKFVNDSGQIETASDIITTTFVIEINTADSLDLQQLTGIGPSFSKRIIKYRDMLGGYYDIKQLLEVYGMDIIRFDGIKDQIITNDSLVKKINVNKATIKEMIKHPYIEFYVAKSIINYRNENGTYTNLEEIKNVRLIYEELFQKIMPYLTTN